MKVRGTAVAVVLAAGGVGGSVLAATLASPTAAVASIECGPAPAQTSPLVNTLIHGPSTYIDVLESFTGIGPAPLDQTLAAVRCGYVVPVEDYVDAVGGLIGV
jgi:hypothetical protein